MKIFLIIFLLISLLVSAGAYAHHKPGHEDYNSDQSLVTGDEVGQKP